MPKRILFAMAAIAAPLAVSAGDLTGRISTIAPILGQDQLYIRLTDTTNNAVPSGSPAGSCSNAFAIAEMGNTNFKNYIYPLILMAQAADAPITLRTNGCLEGLYPIIVGVDYPPR
ncbi:hypothetical protein [Steroidobacter agaridevorans]|uniref:hypothetical protein n=1 Tax=Steroidobacter agaridevorans TaxID=2695856 RepID=UPI00137A8F40|nr:hypothetical protein [Steroidobacter agaridevorans]